MRSKLAGTIRLSGEESINFVNAVMRRFSDRFEADIKDLDLSFLQDAEIR